jgi:hypothetical protein
MCLFQRGIPVATVAINNSTNAALLAIRIIGAFVPGVLDQMDSYMKKMEAEVMGKVEKLNTVVSFDKAYCSYGHVTHINEYNLQGWEDY